ncbi:MAG: hypothetical protein ACTSQJ_15075 [Promethearchaeota archaeon]
MYNNRDIDEQELEALRLIDQAENMIEGGDGEKAINLYEQAASIYLELGSYIKLDELFIKISKIISKFKNNIQAIYRLKNIIRKTEQLKLNEISAKLLMQLGNLANKMQDWETAGESWQKSSEHFFKADPEEYHNLASLFLLKAGQAFEKSHTKKDLGKRLILQAVMKLNKFDELYQTEEKRALHFLVNQDFTSAANKFFDIAFYFRKALDNLGDILDENNEEDKDTFYTAKARLIHFIAEYQTLSALCLRASENRKFNEKIKELGLESLDLFKQSIDLQKKYLFSKKFDYHQEEILRITFDTMLMSIIQSLLGIEKLNPIEYLLKDTERLKILKNKLQETPYFKITTQIGKIGILDSLDKLLQVNLGHFEKIKNTLISYFK